MKKVPSSKTLTHFKTYDIRGIFGKEIKIEDVQNIARSIFTYFLKKAPPCTNKPSDTKPLTIIVAMDGRTHSPEIKKEVLTAATELGINVIDIGICPSPVFYFSLFNEEILQKTNTSTGLIITASHNPKEYNGMKICMDKKSVWGTQIEEIKNTYINKTFLSKTAENIGTVKKLNVVKKYISWMCEHFSHLNGTEIHVAIDCGNGTAGTVLPELVKKMNMKNVKLLFEEVDGTFPNHPPDPTNPKNMTFLRETVKKGFSVGIGLDGDCDRMNPMTKDGELIPGDQLLALYSEEIVKEHPNAPVVFDIKSSDALIQALETMGAKPCIAPSGHSIIKDALRKNNAKIAGELSCHFFFNDRYYGYDDGIYAALRLIELLTKQTNSLKNLLEKLPKKISSPEYRIECEEEDKEKIVESIKSFFAARKDTTLLTIDGVRATMPYGWGLIRASNTQPVICIRFESDTETGLEKIEHEFEQVLQKHFDPKTLRECFQK